MLATFRQDDEPNLDLLGNKTKSIVAKGCKAVDLDPKRPEMPSHLR